MVQGPQGDSRIDICNSCFPDSQKWFKLVFTSLTNEQSKQQQNAVIPLLN